MRAANMFSSAKFQKIVGLPSSHSQKLEKNTVLFSFSQFRTPSLFHLFFHFILLHLEIGNCVFGIFLNMGRF